MQQPLHVQEHVCAGHSPCVAGTRLTACMANSCPGISAGWAARCTTPLPPALPAAAVAACKVLIGAWESLPCSIESRVTLKHGAIIKSCFSARCTALTAGSSLMKRPLNRAPWIDMMGVLMSCPSALCPRKAWPQYGRRNDTPASSYPRKQFWRCSRASHEAPG